MHKKGSLREVIQISWPLVISMLSFTIMDVTDTLMMGQIGTRELAAVGMSTAVMFLINSFFIGFFESVKILVAQAIGANQKKIARLAGFQGLLLAIPIGFLVIGLTFFSPTIFHFFGGPQYLQEMSQNYFNVRLLASPFWFITLVLSSYYQGTGNMKLPMLVNIFMCVFNIISSQILIFGFGKIPAYGIYGSAYATILSDFLGMLIILTQFIRHVEIEFQIQWNLIKKLLILGVPVGIRWLLDTGGWTFVLALIARLGENSLAANQIATKIMCLSLLPVYGISEAACVLTGQCTGAGDYLALKHSYWSTIKISVTVMLVTGLFFVILPIPLVSLFDKNIEIITLSSQILILVAFYQVLSAFSLVTSGALNGTGDTQFTMMVLILSTWFVMVPSAYYFGIILEMGVLGMWLSLIVHESIMVLATQWRFHSERWKNHAAIVRK